jgi:MFS family permease
VNDRTRNHLILVANPAFFGLGFNLMSPVTILPVFVSFLTDSNVLIGAINPVVRMAWAIPLIYGARYFEGHVHKARRMFVITTIGRILFIAFATYVIVSGGRPAALALALFFVALFVLWGTDGITSPAWAEIFSKIIDPRSRGRLMGLAQTCGGILAGVGVFFAARFLDANPTPAGFAKLFIVAALVLEVSHGLFLFLREPPSDPIQADPSPIWRAGARIPRLLREDRHFGSLIVARVLIGFGMTSFGFFAVFATRDFDVGIREIGIFTTVLLVTQTAANLVSGFLNDRIGPIRLVAAGGSIVLIASVLAVATPTSVAFYPIFVCVGLSQAAFAIADFTLIFNAAPPEKMTTYLATYNATMAPLLVVAALSAGLLVDLAGGYRPMFVISGLFALLGVALMLRVAGRAGRPGGFDLNRAPGAETPPSN